MYGGFDLTPLVTGAIGAVAGIVGLLLAVLVGVWFDLPSWAFLVAFAAPAIVVGGWFHIRFC